MVSTRPTSNCGARRSRQSITAKTCVASHEQVLREKGLSEEQVAAAVRIAAVIHAAAVVLDAAA